MAEIIDILTPNYTDCPYYTVNTGAKSVALGAGAAIKMYVSGASSLIAKFQSKDNLRIISAGFYIPENFVLAETNTGGAPYIPLNQLQLFVYNSTPAETAKMPGCGGRGVIPIPFSNYELTLDIFCDISSLTLNADNYFYIYSTLWANRLSMVGVPAAFDTDHIHAIPFLKILHTFPIIA